MSDIRDVLAAIAVLQTDMKNLRETQLPELRTDLARLHERYDGAAKTWAGIGTALSVVFTAFIAWLKN